MKVQFFRCKVCGNIVELINDGGGELVCCGEPMVALKANTTDAATEKHVPVVEKDGDTLLVKVGSVAHPMTAEHYIQWVAVVTESGIFRKALNPGDKPEVAFCSCMDTVVSVYEYCNLHGLWKKDL
jgi:superoxide reductase